ncbi:DDHD domain-containing protein [Purpureocillium lavendulum]|uniref:DDHD domain-containing protein n=1 Tax=Purpureocillium lavendulum TaxID=1247861 RepID=A0AB34FE53_9HYPO|nr:DDHD domain-containing protein [Purpureocillium lavendulum]
MRLSRHPHLAPHAPHDRRVTGLTSLTHFTSLTLKPLIVIHFIPSAIALGTAFNHGIELAVLSPIFGQTYQRAKTANTKEEFLRSKEASGAAAAWGTSFVGAALQSYGVGALINATGTLSYKGAAYLGGLIFAATAAPTFLVQVFSEKRPLDTVGVSVAAKLFETVGLSIFLTWWGTRTNPFD